MKPASTQVNRLRQLLSSLTLYFAQNQVRPTVLYIQIRRRCVTRKTTGSDNVPVQGSVISDTGTVTLKAQSSSEPQISSIWSIKPMHSLFHHSDRMTHPYTRSQCLRSLILNPYTPAITNIPCYNKYFRVKVRLCSSLHDET